MEMSNLDDKKLTKNQCTVLLVMFHSKQSVGVVSNYISVPYGIAQKKKLSIINSSILTDKLRSVKKTETKLFLEK